MKLTDPGDMNLVVAVFESIVTSCETLVPSADAATTNEWLALTSTVAPLCEGEEAVPVLVHTVPVLKDIMRVCACRRQVSESINGLNPGNSSYSFSFFI